MSFRQFREIRLQDFRCFREQQAARLAPLTLLVGDNSTGKTSFLAAVRAAWDAAHGSGDPDFRKPPFDLGAFPDIVHSRGGRGKASNSFAIGLRELTPEARLLDFEATFESRDAAPTPTTTSWRAGAISAQYRLAHGKNPRIVFESPDGAWEHIVPDGHRPFAERWGVGTPSSLQVAEPTPEPSEYIGGLRALPKGSPRRPSAEDQAAFSLLYRLFGRVSSEEPPFASAPNHPGPRRTYDPAKLSSDPWGGDVPSLLANLHLRNKAAWAELKERLDAFGRESGLFDDFSVRQLTDVEGGPFQLQVRKFGRKGRKGPRRNLMDVGFGISQVLPVLAALLRASGPSMFLLQQPELHLHPSAQAALGSLFCRTVEAGRQLIVETHSDYLMNRIRLDIRDRRTTLRPEDVTLLYFERDDLDVRIHPIGFDGDGNVQDAPPNYRRFFTDELNRSLDY